MDTMTAPITVAFDDQIFVAQSRGGVSRTFVELFMRLPALGVEPLILSRSTRNRHLAESGLVPHAPVRSPLGERAAWVSWRLLGHPRDQKAPFGSYDVLHHTFTHPSYLRFGHGPRVVSVYDFMPERFPHLFKLGNPHFAKHTFARRADAIITNSASTSADLARFYGEQIASKATVAHLGVGEAYLESRGDDLEVPARYVLFVGVRAGYKEFARFVEAVAPLVLRNAGLDVVLAGGGALDDGERALLARRGIGDRVVHVTPTDAQMPTLYARASVFVFPSLYEGFGLPTLEALASGTPVVLADDGCSREVGGPLAEFFAPGDATAMRAAIERAMSERVTTSVAGAGPDWSRQFTWDRTAAIHAEVYRTLLN